MTARMQAVQIGAGRIGRGFLGEVYWRSGCDTTFVETNQTVVDLLNRARSYPLRLAGLRGGALVDETLRIDSVRALDPSRSRHAVIAALAAADIAGTSVGVSALPLACELLAASINSRAACYAPPINILLCENQRHCAQLAASLIRPHLDRGALAYFDSRVGLVETVVGRMAPATSDEQRAREPLLVVAEPFFELPVAAAMARGALPPLAGVVAVAEFDACELRKLYMHNAAHAALAYAGALCGYRLISECVGDEIVRALAESVLAGVRGAICTVFPGTPGMDYRALQGYAADLIQRFANPLLADTVARVAAGPLRKLRPDDRLVGAARFCAGNGAPNSAILRAIACALLYEDESDPEAETLRCLRAEFPEGRALVARVVGDSLGESERDAAAGWYERLRPAARLNDSGSVRAILAQQS